MSKNFEAKKVVVSEIEEKIEKAQSIVIVEYKALTVEAITALRAKCRVANVDYCVLKNTLMKRALENQGHQDRRRGSRRPERFRFQQRRSGVRSEACQGVHHRR